MTKDNARAAAEIVVETDMSWITLAACRNGIVLHDFSPGWTDYFDGLDMHFSDVFDCEEPELPVGLYKWSGYTIGSWDEGDLVSLHGGNFEPLAPLRTDAQTKEGDEPVAYMRRWAYEKNEGTKGNRPPGWNFSAVTRAKILADDVPLYLRPSQGEGIAEMVDLEAVPAQDDPVARRALRLYQDACTTRGNTYPAWALPLWDSPGHRAIIAALRQSQSRGEG